MLISCMHLLTEEDSFFEVIARVPNPTRFLSSSHVQLQCPMALITSRSQNTTTARKGRKVQKRFEGWQVSSFQVLEQILTQQPTASPRTSQSLALSSKLQQDFISAMFHAGA